MKYLWVDTETTGLDPKDSAPFEISAIIVEGGEVRAEKSIRLNPLSDAIVWHKEVEEVTGITEAEVRGYQSEAEGIREFVRFLFDNITDMDERYTIAGYNINFDYQHLKSQMQRCGYAIENYISGSWADVFEQVKNAGRMKILPYLPNRKLGTICNFLNIGMEKAHEAMSDIKATREVARRLHSYGCQLKLSEIKK